MDIRRSLAFFGIPGVLICIALYLGVPVATEYGLPLILTWSLGLWLPILGVLAWVLLRRWHEIPGSTFRSKFRLRKLTRQEWIVVVVAFLLVQVCELSQSAFGSYFSDFPYLPTPSVIPELFNPHFEIKGGLTTFFNVPVVGNWWLVLFWLGWLVVNIGGEELLWRGYALPLQERVFGKYAWIVNGLCWNLLIHAFMWWNFLTLMPISLAVPYLVQRYQNTWIGIYLHGLGNLMVLIILIPSIAGWI